MRFRVEKLPSVDRSSRDTEDMARYAEDVYYEFAMKLTHDAAQVSIHIFSVPKKFIPYYIGYLYSC